MPERLAVIIGSGWTGLPSTDCAAETDWGEPSGPVQSIRIGDVEVLALARHGAGHTLPPHRINYRANIAALNAAGVTEIVGLNTVGAVTRVRAPGQIAVPEQILDYTWGREHTFFDGGDMQHIDFTAPFSARLRGELLAAAEAYGVDCHDGGVYAATQGPRLETAAEVDRLERDGADFVGMTAMPEASLAAEAGIDYACLALVVNRAAGRGERPIHEDVERSTYEAREAATALLESLCLKRNQA